LNRERPHFLYADDLERARGQARFFPDWIEREVRSKAWARAGFKWRQGDMLDR